METNRDRGGDGLMLLFLVRLLPHLLQSQRGTDDVVHAPLDAAAVFIFQLNPIYPEQS